MGNWIKLIRVDHQGLIVLLGNKLDLRKYLATKKMKIPYEFARENNLLYFQVSAKSGENVNECFEKPTKMILANLCQPIQKFVYQSNPPQRFFWKKKESKFPFYLAIILITLAFAYFMKK